MMVYVKPTIINTSRVAYDSNDMNNGCGIVSITSCSLIVCRSDTRDTQFN